MESSSKGQGVKLSDIPVAIAADAAARATPVTSVQTTCPYCGVGCGVRAQRHADGTVEVAGDPSHPANAGRLCVKGSALAETVGLNDRL
ncbi:hypothetical protein, partial [Vibrio parahaemolyticus]